MALISMITTTAQTVLTNGVVPLTNVARRKGCCVTAGNNSIQINKTGYYLVEGTVTFTVPTAGLVTLALQKNGNAIAGITASLTATVGASSTLPISGVVRVNCCDGVPSSLTLVNTGVGITTSNINLSVVGVD